MRHLHLHLMFLVMLGLSHPAWAQQPLETVPTPSATIKRQPPYLVGDTVEAHGNWWGQSTWYVSVIVEIKDGKYRIHYGGGRYNTDWIGEDRLRNELREKEEQAVRDLQAAFWKESKPFEPGVEMLVRLVMKPDGGVTWTISNRPDDLKAALAQLAELDRICKARYSALRDTETTWKDDYTKLPATWCKTAAQRQALATTYATAATSQRVAEQRKWLTTLAERYAVSDVHVAAGSWYAVLYPRGHDKVKGIIRTDELDDLLDGGGAKTLARIRGEVSGYFAVVGATEDAATLAFYDEQTGSLADVKARVEASLPASVFVAKGKDTAMQNGGKADISGKILKTAVLSPKWVVTVDENGHAENRVKIGSIVYKIGGRCIYRSYVWKQYPRGRGWDAGAVTEATEFYQRCK